MKRITFPPSHYHFPYVVLHYHRQATENALLCDWLYVCYVA
jgi:hypothetical protein